MRLMFEKMKTGRDAIISVFEGGMNELAEEVVTSPHAARYVSWTQMASFVGREFTGWQSVHEALASPWEQGERIVEGMLKEIPEETMPKLDSIARKTKYRDDDGDEVCVDRVLAGRPEFWRLSKRTHSTGPTRVTIVTNISTLCNLPPSKVLWRGAAALCLTKLLEQAGYRVEIWAMNTCEGGHHKSEGNRYKDADFICGYRLKHYGQRVDIGSIVAGVSGWFFRTLVFGSTMLSINKFGYLPTGGLGSPRSITPDDIRHVTREAPDKTIIVEDLWDRMSAIGWIESNLESVQTRQVVGV